MGGLTNEEFVKMLQLFAERQNAKFLASTISIGSPDDSARIAEEKERYLQTMAEKDAEIIELVNIISSRKTTRIEMESVSFEYQEKEL